MTTTPPVTNQLDRAVAATAGLLAGVGNRQWTLPTCCPDWNVRQLVNHIVGGNFGFAAVLTGQPWPNWTDDHLDADPVAAFHRSGRELVTAFAQDGVLEKMVTVPAGTVPGVAALHLRMTELLVHGWDLAQATDQPTTDLPADLAEQEYVFSAGKLDDLPPGRSPFAAPRPIPDDAPAIDQLAALLGRAVQ